VSGVEGVQQPESEGERQGGEKRGFQGAVTTGAKWS
jgi:hypothetical protein